MITQTEVELYVRIKPYYEFVEFVSTMPGMTELSSTIVLAETGVDMSIFDLYNGKCEFVKAGAAVTFLRTKDGVEHIRSESLPLGVIQRQQSEKETRQLESGDVVVMVSDGILDALPAGEQEHLLDLMIGGSPLENPEELANYILDKVLELAAGKAGDDMTVLVAGIWKMCYSR